MKLFLRVGEGATVKVTIPKSWHAQPVRRLLALAVATHNTRGGAPLAEDAAHLSRDGVDLRRTSSSLCRRRRSRPSRSTSSSASSSTSPTTTSGRPT